MGALADLSIRNLETGNKAHFMDYKPRARLSTVVELGRLVRRAQGTESSLERQEGLDRLGEFLMRDADAARLAIAKYPDILKADFHLKDDPEDAMSEGYFATVAAGIAVAHVDTDVPALIYLCHPDPELFMHRGENGESIISAIAFGSAAVARMIVDESPWILSTEAMRHEGGRSMTVADVILDRAMFNDQESAVFAPVARDILRMHAEALQRNSPAELLQQYIEEHITAGSIEPVRFLADPQVLELLRRLAGDQ